MLWPALLHSWVRTHSITWVRTHSITWVRTRSITWVRTRSTSRVPANTCSITWLRTRSITYYLPITGSNNRVVMVGLLNEIIDLIWVIDVTTILFFISMTTCWLYVDFKIQRFFFFWRLFKKKKVFIRIIYDWKLHCLKLLVSFSSCEWTCSLPWLCSPGRTDL